jgi:hypothetical protein
MATDAKPKSGDVVGSDGKVVIQLDGLANLVKQLVRLQVEVVTLPFNLLSPEPRRYAVDAIRQAFKAVRVAVDDVSDTIDASFVRAAERGESAK